MYPAQSHVKVLASLQALDTDIQSSSSSPSLAQTPPRLHLRPADRFQPSPLNHSSASSSVASSTSMSTLTSMLQRSSLEPPTSSSPNLNHRRASFTLHQRNIMASPSLSPSPSPCRSPPPLTLPPSPALHSHSMSVSPHSPSFTLRRTSDPVREGGVVEPVAFPSLRIPQPHPQPLQPVPLHFQQQQQQQQQQRVAGISSTSGAHVLVSGQVMPPEGVSILSLAK